MSHVRPNYTAVSPYLMVEDASGLVSFVAGVFDAEFVDDDRDSGGKVLHAALKVNDAVIEISEANPQWGHRTCALHVYVPDVDVTYARALDSGASSLYEPSGMAYGERSAAVSDAWGNHWYLATYTG